MSDQETGNRPTGDQHGDETTPKEQPHAPAELTEPLRPTEATETSAASADDALEADPPTPEPSDEHSDTPGEKPVEKRPPAALPIIGLLAAIGAIGGGGYYIWDAQRAEQLAGPQAAAQAAAVEELQKTLAATTARLAASEARLAASEANFSRLSQQLGQDFSEKLAAAESRLGLRAEQQQAAAVASQAQTLAAARLATAQSLLGALRRGEDFSDQLAALSALGADPADLAALRGALGTPSTAALSAQFFALAPRLLAEPATPAEAAQQPAAASAGAADALWARAEAIGRKLVHIRGEATPAPIDPAGPVAAVEAALKADNLAGALKARLGLPASALAASADWARAVQARLDAERAAQAELAAALQSLAKTKS